ncbi:hypothetical protein SHIRM173S_01569 [Streptomyces hirsutus]
MEAYPWFWISTIFTGSRSWTAVTISVGIIRYVPSPTSAHTGVPGAACWTPIAAGIS